MSIRFRLALLYSVILALTLIALGVGIYAAVSQLTFSAASDAVTSEAKTVASTVQPHLGPGPNAGPGSGPSTAPHGGGAAGTHSGFPSSAAHGFGQNPGAGTDTDNSHSNGTGIGIFLPPPDLASGSTIQIRDITGTVVYSSPDLQAAKVVLPLSTATRGRLTPGSVSQSVVEVGSQRLLVACMLLVSHQGPVGILEVGRSLQDLDRTLSTLRQILLIGGAIVTLLAFAGGWWLAGTALRPINRITHTAAEIGATQDFGRRVTYKGPPDEVGRLAGTFNTMLTRLQAAYHAQRRFAADASHELRTPLTSIRGNLGLLQRNPPIAEEDRIAVVSDLVSETERLSRLVSDLLALARSDAGRAYDLQPVSLRPLVSDVIRRFSVLHPERAIQQEVRGEVTALGNHDALTQLLLILLDNALKFTPGNGKVTIRGTARGDRAVIEVRDTGAGIAPADLPHVFERFYQGDTARSESGSGLGLAIAKTLVDGLGGTIEVESAIGQGTRFTITLPRSGHGSATGDGMR